MLSKWFGKKKQQPVSLAPEVMGLRLGGAFELADLKLRLIEPKLLVDGVSRTQFIQAVGVVNLDENTTVLRYYTDDEGYLQILLTGGMTENYISDVKIFYFYDTKSVNNEAQWDELIRSSISQPTVELENFQFERVWGSVGQSSAPVAMTEKTYAENGASSETDQFAMLYQREIEPDLFEYLLRVGEEKIIDNRADRCFVVSTAFDIQPADIDIIG